MHTIVQKTKKTKNARMLQKYLLFQHTVFSVLCVFVCSLSLAESMRTLKPVGYICSLDTIFVAIYT